MKIIDKRKPDEINIGDIICYYSVLTNKHYVYIAESGDAVLVIDLKTNFVISSVESLDEILETLQSGWEHVERVNAKLLVED